MSDDGHGDRLSPIDASFLALESSSVHMHVAWSATAAAPEDRSPPAIEDLRARVAARLAWVPRCRQRLLPAPLGLSDPCWVDDPRFDVANHVVELGDHDEEMSPARFAAARDGLLSTPLDHERPLWQLAFARLDDGRIATVGRVHHAMADGAAALQVALLAFDVDEAGEAPPAPWRPAPAPGTLQRALEPLAHSAAVTARTARDVVRSFGRPRSAARDVLRDAGRAAQALTVDMLPRAPGSQLNGELGPRRTLVQHRVPLAALRGATRDSRATRNDAGIAIVAGALRALALERGMPAHALKALVPVNTRRPEEYGELGNRVSMTSVWLPLELASPRGRLERVRGQTERFKRGARPAGAQTVLSGLGLVPRALRAPVLRAAAPSRFNLTISSVVGPRRALYLFGARLEEIYPVIPLAEEQALSIGLLAYEGHLHFGLYADPDALPHADRLAELIDDEVGALLHARPEEDIHDRRPFAAAPVGA